MYKEPVYIWSSGLGRILELMKESSVGIISAFRDYRTKEENLALTEELRAAIRLKGFGYVPVQGEWKENENSVSVEKSFAISRPGLTFEQLLANLVEIGRYDQEINQQAYFIASEGKGYLIAGEDPVLYEGYKTGEIVAVKDNLTVSVMEQWLSMEQTERTTMAKGPEGRSFTWSCAQLIDTFHDNMALIKGIHFTGMRQAPERVANGLPWRIYKGRDRGKRLISLGFYEDVDGYPIMENEFYEQCPRIGKGPIPAWKKQHQKGSDFAGEVAQMAVDARFPNGC